MRSLEPEASQLSPEGNPPTALSDGEPWSGVRPDTGVQGRSRCEVNKNEAAHFCPNLLLQVSGAVP